MQESALRITRIECNLYLYVWYRTDDGSFVTELILHYVSLRKLGSPCQEPNTNVISYHRKHATQWH